MRRNNAPSMLRSHSHFLGLFYNTDPGPDPIKIFSAQSYTKLEFEQSDWLKMVTSLETVNKNDRIPAQHNAKLKIVLQDRVQVTRMVYWTLSETLLISQLTSLNLSCHSFPDISSCIFTWKKARSFQKDPVPFGGAQFPTCVLVPESAPTSLSTQVFKQNSCVLSRSFFSSILRLKHLNSLVSVKCFTCVCDQ